LDERGLSARGLRTIDPDRSAPKPIWKDRGCYIITGGIGAIGKTLAESAVRSGNIALVLAGRSPLDPQKSEILESWRALGANVTYVVADVGEIAGVRSVVDEARKTGFPLRGIIHAAGTIDDSLLSRKDRISFDRVLRPKLHGVIYLDFLTREEPLDFFLCLSSLSSILGVPGQSDYSAGNAFLDGFMLWRESLRHSQLRSGYSRAINLPFWQGGGMVLSEESQKWMEQFGGLRPLAAQDGQRLINWTLSQNEPQIAIVPGDAEKFKTLLRNRANVQKSGTATVKVAGSLPAANLILIQIISELLGLRPEEIDPQARLGELGFDSLQLSRLGEELHKKFPGLTLDPAVFFENPTVESLSKLLGGTNLPETEPRASMVIAQPKPSENKNEAIAVIGMAGRFPGAQNTEEFWELLASGADCITEIPRSRWNADIYTGKSVCKWGGFLENVDRFDPLFFRISPREAASMDPQERLFLETAWHTIENAGYTPARLRTNINGSARRIGVFAGITWGSYQLLSAEEWSKGNMVLGSSSYWSVANRVSWFLDCTGPSIAVDTACSSSLAAIHLAVQSLRRGECEVALAGGVNLLLHPSKYVALSGLGFLSADGRCRSFGRGANGFVPGEGVGALLLKPLSLAEADGDRIDAVILGSAMNQDGLTASYTVPNPDAQAELIGLALKDAAVGAQTINYIEAHGTGTEVGDPLELRGLEKAFRRQTSQTHFCSLGSVKSNIGHLEAAAGVASAIKVILQMRHSTLVPSLHCAEPNPTLDLTHSPFVLQSKLEPWSGHQRAGISSFGAGGTNVHIILESYKSSLGRSGAEDRPSNPAILQLSARTPDALRRIATNLADHLETRGASQNLSDIAYTLRWGRMEMEHRAAIAANSVGEAAQKLRGWIAGSSFDDLPESAKSWVLGQTANSPALQADIYGQMAVLPGYPFEQERHWLQIIAPSQEPDSQQEDPKILCPIWRPSAVNQSTETFDLLLFAPDIEIAQKCQRELAQFRRVTVVLPGASRFEVLESRTFRIDPDEEQHYERLFSECPTAKGILHCWDLVPMAEADSWYGPLRRMFLLCQSLLKVKPGQMDIHYFFGGQDRGIAERDAVGGFRRSITAASADLRLRTIRVEAATADWPSILNAEAQTSWSDNDIFYRGGVRLTRDFVPLDRTARASQKFAENGVYLISGAAGSLGSKLALHLAQSWRARIIMTGRSPHSPAIQALIESVQIAGGEAAYFQVDIASESEMRAVLTKAEVLLGPVQGVIHCAGVQGRGTLGEMSWCDFESVLRPKLEGVRVLYRLLDFRNLDFVVLFSSLASVAGDLGSCNYACANRYLDAFAESTGCISIDWPLWAEGGMNLESEARDMYLAATKLRLLTTEAGIQAFNRVLQHSPTRTLVLDADDSAIRGLLQAAEKTLLKPGASTAVAPAGVEGSVEEELKNLAASVLSIDREKLNSRTGFSEYGFDSILLKDFAARIVQRYNVNISPSIFFRFSNILALAQHLKESGVTENNLFVLPRPAPSDEEEVAIVGISGMFPGSSDLEEFWHNLEEGRDLISETPADRWDWRQCSRDLAGTGREESARWGGFIKQVAEFDPLFFGISPREAEQMDPQHRLFLQNTWHAIENAGIRPSSLAGSRTAVFAGVQMNEYVERFRAGAGTHVATGNARAMLSNRVSYLLDLRGPSEVIDTACSSSLVAVHRAVQSIRSGEAEFAIAGGVHLLLSPDAVLMAARMGVLSPSGRCRTFDRQADGYVKGEGVGVVFLKSARQARQDGDYIHAIIRGTGVNHGGQAMSLTAPNAEAQANLITTVYERAGIDPDSVTFIEAHGTGTPLGDPVEVDALIEAFERLRGRSDRSSSAPYCWLGSVKTNIGHLEPASGIAGLLKVILALRHKKIPATLHQDSVNPLLRLERGRFRISRSTQDWEPFIDPSGLPVFRAGVSSFGFGGTNCHLLLERSEVRQQQNNPQLQNVPEIIPISAKNPKALKEAVRGLLEALQTWGKDYPLRSVAHTLQTGRDTFAERVAFVASDRENLFVQMQNWLNGVPAVFGDSKAEQGAREWMSAGNLVWDIEPGVKCEKVPLPGYPFSSAKHWVPVKPKINSLPPEIRRNSTDAVKSLRSLISQTLGIAEEDLADNAELSALGVDSLVQMELRQSLEKIFDFSLPIDVFLRYPTIEQLAANLPPTGRSKSLQRSPSSPLMTFHENGQQAPSFWIHGAPGDTNWLWSLSQSLGPDFPLFGIEAVESASETSVEELAEYYLSVIRESGRAQRYRIGGYSFGGAVAVEMCRALEQKGELVEDLILLDTYAPGSADLRYLKENTILTHPAFPSLLIGNMLVRRWNAPRLLEFADFHGVEPEEYAEVIASRVGKHSPLNREQLISSIGKASRLAARHDGFLNSYRPEPFACRARVTLFRATLGFTAERNTLALPPISAPAGDSPLVWCRLLGTDVAIREFSCDHFGLLSGPEAGGVADELRKILSFQTEKSALK
jgi:acyl transferase domain-containing protein/thioesterase domain-containing protein/NAD(P)-dependent dehydrogenase (short-subunit alcohol dehydrogenase family)/acyl carrier protein